MGGTLADGEPAHRLTQVGCADPPLRPLAPSRAVRGPKGLGLSLARRGADATPLLCEVPPLVGGASFEASTAKPETRVSNSAKAIGWFLAAACPVSFLFDGSSAPLAEAR